MSFPTTISGFFILTFDGLESISRMLFAQNGFNSKTDFSSHTTMLGMEGGVHVKAYVASQSLSAMYTK